MLPIDRKEFTDLVIETLAGYNRNAGEATLNAWWNGLKTRSLSDIRRVLQKMVSESSEIPTVSRVIHALRDEAPLTNTSATPLKLNPNKTTLLAARRHLDMFGEIKARDAYGDEAVNMILADPTKGYTAVDPRTYGARDQGDISYLPQHILDDLAEGRRLPDDISPTVNITETAMPRKGA